MQTFECTVKGTNWHTNVTARTSGKAKADYFRRVRDPWPDTKFTDIRCRSLGRCITDQRFLDTAKYRGVPFARIGMRVTVDGKWGTIVGNNDSANFNVIFDGSDAPLNCHPNWMMTYYADDGTVLAEFKS
jgi:hypothetical protein